MKKYFLPMSLPIFLVSCATNQKVEPSKERAVASEPEATEKIDRAPATFSDPTPFNPHGGIQGPPQQLMTRLEDVGGCQLGFGNVYLNNQNQRQFSVGDLMANLPQGKITGVHSYDRQYLNQWFLGHSYDAELLEMAKGSKGLTAALELVHGPISTCGEDGNSVCNKYDYYTAQRMAAILAMIRATSHDAECAKAIKKWGLALLAGQQNKIKNTSLLEELPIDQALTFKQNGTLIAEFHKLEAKRQDIEDRLLNIASLLEKFEDENRKEKEKIERSELLPAFVQLEERLKKIPLCQQAIRNEKLMQDLDPNKDDAKVVAAINKRCLTALEERAAKLSAKQTKIMTGRPDGDLNPATDVELEKIKSEIEAINGFRTLLTDTKDVNSVAYQTEVVNEILGRKSALTNSPEIKRLTSQRKEIENEKALIGNTWITYGLLGGFDAPSPPSKKSTQP